MIAFHCHRRRKVHQKEWTVFRQQKFGLKINRGQLKIMRSNKLENIDRERSDMINKEGKALQRKIKNYFSRKVFNYKIWFQNMFPKLYKMSTGYYRRMLKLKQFHDVENTTHLKTPARKSKLIRRRAKLVGHSNHRGQVNSMTESAVEGNNSCGRQYLKLLGTSDGRNAVIWRV